MKNIVSEVNHRGSLLFTFVKFVVIQNGFRMFVEISSLVAGKPDPLHWKLAF
jgi:hypothetical protein